MANLTAEEISRLVMATPPRAFDAQQFQPVIAPPDSHPDPNMQPIQVADAQPAQAQADAPVSIALPQPAQAPERQFTPVMINAGEPQRIPQLPQAPAEIAAPQIGPNYAYPPGTSTIDLPNPAGPSVATIGKLPAPAILPTDTDNSESNPLSIKTAKDQTELERRQKSGSGISQIFHPVDSDGDPDQSKHPGFFRKLGGIAARIGDIAGTALFPSVAAMIPGTELHHQVLMGQQRGIVNEDFSQQKQAADTAQTQAKTFDLQHPAPEAPKLLTPEQQAFTYLTSNGMKPPDAFQRIKDMANTKQDTPEHSVYSYLVAQGKTPVEAFGAIYDTKNVKDKQLPQQYLEALQSGDTAKASLIQRVIKDTSTQPKIEIKNAGGGGAMGGIGTGPLSPASLALVDQIGLGKMSMANLDRILTKNPELMAAVADKYPDFDQSKIKGYTSATRDFTGAGKYSIQLNSGSTALRHLAQLKQINDDNPIAVHNPTTAAYKAYNNLLDTVADELGTFYGEPKTNEVIAAKKATLGGLLNRGAAIQEQAMAMGAKFDELENTWNNAAPSAAYHKPMPGYSQAAKEARAKLDPEYAKRIGQTGGSLTVTRPDGKTYTFKDQAAADSFRQSAGISGDTGGGNTEAIYARDPSGKLHQATAGSVLPAGWKQEKR